MTSKHRREQLREWVEDGTRRVELGCICGWTASPNDGWDALAEFYDHAGVFDFVPPPDAVDRFLGASA